jgi:hypothetical protein
MSRIKFLLFLLALAAQVPLASATVTYAVGTCKPTLPSFTTIQGALDALPPPNVVEVCPGTYNEQVVIGIPVTLEGISYGNSAEAMIAPRANGIVVANATNDFGQVVAAQVLVSNVAGEVNLTNLTVQGQGGFPSDGIRYVGVFYQNSSGTMNHLGAHGQFADRLGFSVWLEGGSANPSVTLENSTVGVVDNSAIVVETNASTSELTATVKGNYIFPIPDTLYGIDLVGGATASMSGNLYWGAGSEAILIFGGEASVARNTVVGPVGTGIDFEVDGVYVTSNTIYNTGTGIFTVSAVAPVTGNYITLSGTAIDYACVAGNNVHSNTILDAIDGIYEVPATAAPSNTYYNVGTIRGGSC